MAEGFARRYGSDVLEAESAGLMPAAIIQPLTREVMLEKNITIEEQFPKYLRELKPEDFDLVVNISGLELPPGWSKRVETWRVRDPIGASEEVYRAVRDQIEMLVMKLIIALRR